jgi:DNA topoisomerase-1
MKSLSHFGLYFPRYNPVGLSIEYKHKKIDLNPISEEMAIHFVKKFDTDYIKDEVFVNNFLQDFGTSLGLKETPKMDNIDWSTIKSYISEVKAKTDSMSKDDRKLAIQLKKALRNKLQEKFAYALVDDTKVPIMNWTVEPAAIFMSKGTNSLRGKWKRAPSRDEVTLNLSEKPAGFNDGWKEIVWHPTEMWIASWKSPLDNKMKYVWFSPASSIRQNRDIQKWNKIETLANHIRDVEKYIEANLTNKEVSIRKTATVAYLIRNIGIRVGDEKIAGEIGTLGCTTLKKKNVILNETMNSLHLDFIAKDYVRWVKDVDIPKQVIKNIKEFIKDAGDDFIFKGVDSMVVSKFLQNVVHGITAKSFRTYLAGKTFHEATDTYESLYPDLDEMTNKTRFRYINLEVAKRLNHKRKLVANYKEKARKKEEKSVKLARELGFLLNAVRTLPQTKEREEYLQKISSVRSRYYKAKQDQNLFKDTAEWNLNTSLQSYISPKFVKAYCEKHGMDIKQVYSKSLCEKYSWLISEGENCDGKKAKE